MEIAEQELVDLVCDNKIEKALVAGMLNSAYKKGFADGLEQSKKVKK